MFCRNCGTRLPDTASFCVSCGTPVPRPAAPVTAVPTPPVLPVEPTPAAAEAPVVFPPEGTVFQAPLQEPAPAYVQPPIESIIYAPVLEPMGSPAPVETTKPVSKKAGKQRHRPHIAVRIPMQVLSFVLCIVLMMSLLVNALLLDVRRMTSSDGLENTVSAILGTADTSENAAQRSEESLDAVVDIAYDVLSSQDGLTIDFSKKDLHDFVDKSTLPEFLTDKLVDYTMDVLHGTENAELSADELMDLLEENEAVLEQELGIRLTAADKQIIAQELKQEVDQKDLSGTIRQTVDDTLEQNMGMDPAVLQDTLRWFSGDALLYISLGLSLLLVAMLCALNYYNIGAGLSWSASAGLSAGLLLTTISLLAQWFGNQLVATTPELGSIGSVFSAVLPTIFTIPYWLLIGSAVLLLASVALRVTFWILRRRRQAAL